MLRQGARIQAHREETSLRAHVTVKCLESIKSGRVDWSRGGKGPLIDYRLML